MHEAMDTRKRLGRSLSIGIVVTALILGAVVLHLTTRYPRTDDAEILANFIGIAPQVEGPIVRLNVHDNQFVTRGAVLFEIDDRPYRYALAQALSEQSALEGQIADERRRIIAIGAQVFILPHVDSIAGFTVLFVAVTTGAVWIVTSTPRLSYFGTQLALAFY